MPGFPARLQYTRHPADAPSKARCGVINRLAAVIIVVLEIFCCCFPQALHRLVGRVSDAWSQGPVGHIEVGPRGRKRRATGGVLLTPDLPPIAYTQLVRLAGDTLEAERLFLWDGDGAEWITFDADTPIGVPSGDEGRADLRSELLQHRFRRFD